MATIGRVLTQEHCPAGRLPGRFGRGFPQTRKATPAPCTAGFPFVRPDSGPVGRETGSRRSRDSAHDLG
jgi:hypothetical protein